MQELLFDDATIVTMDRDRAILEHTSVAIRGERIVQVGPAASLRERYRTAKVIDCRRKAVMPGMVDLHGYLGGSLLKSAGQNPSGGARRTMLDNLLPDFTDEAWWEADAQLNALERLKMGTTCMLEGRKLLTADKAAVLEHAQAVYRRFVERADLAPHTRNSERFWGTSRSQ